MSSQLAVCKGLVIDKLHRLKYAHTILAKHTCRASYGILYNEPYDRRRHSKTNMPAQIHKNPIDGQQYAIKRICWLIEKGRPVLRDRPICRRFYRMITRADVDLLGAQDNMIHWVDTIAMSKTRPERLPTWLHEGDVEEVGEIASALPLSQLLSACSSNSPSSSSATSAAVKHKRRRNWIGRCTGEYWKVDFQLRMFAGSAGLRFEVWCGDRLIGETGQIAVNWVYPTARRGLDVLVVGDGDDALVETEVVEGVDPDWVRGLVPMAWRSSDGDLETLE
jgi:hypothetical protein